MIRVSIFDGVLNKIIIQEHSGVLRDYAFRNHFDKIVDCYGCTGKVFLSMVPDESVCLDSIDDDSLLCFVTIVLDWTGDSATQFAMALYHGLKYSYGLS